MGAEHFGGGFSHCGDFCCCESASVEANLVKSLEEEFDAVGAGEDEPVEGV